MPHLPERLVELANIKLNRMGARAKKMPGTGPGVSPTGRLWGATTGCRPHEAYL